MRYEVIRTDNGEHRAVPLEPDADASKRLHEGHCIAIFAGPEAKEWAERYAASQNALATDVPAGPQDGSPGSSQAGRALADS